MTPIQFTGQQVEVTDTLKKFTTDKFERLHRHVDSMMSIEVIYSIQKLRHMVDATIYLAKGKLHATSESESDMYTAVDLLVDKLDRQLIKHKEKQQDH